MITFTVLFLILPPNIKKKNNQKTQKKEKKLFRDVYVTQLDAVSTVN